MLWMSFAAAAQAQVVPPRPDLQASFFEYVPYAGGGADLDITVMNSGPVTSSGFYIDFFFGSPVVPTPGMFGDCYGWVPSLIPNWPTRITIECDEFASFGPGWIDILLDSDRLVLESNENNNLDSFWGAGNTGAFERDLLAN